jgi:hypothetical protein
VPTIVGETSYFTYEIGGWVGPTTGLDVWERENIFSVWELNPISLNIQASFNM